MMTSEFLKMYSLKFYIVFFIASVILLQLATVSYNINLHIQSKWYLSIILFLILTQLYHYSKFRKEIKEKNEETEYVINQKEQDQILFHRQKEDILKQYNLILNQNSYLNKAFEEAKIRKQKLKKFIDKIIEVSRMDEIHSGSLEFSINTLKNTILEILEVDSVRIWKYEQIQEAIHTIYEAEEPSEIIYRKNCPTYFDQLEAGVVLVEEDIRQGKHTQELRAYFEKHNFKSLMDCPFFIDGKFAGVICCNSHDFRAWESEDILFVRAMAGAVSLSHKSATRNVKQDKLIEEHQEVHKTNLQLENQIITRNKILKEINDKLIEYAFINSHKIRKPICSLLGLKKLLDLTDDVDEIMVIKNHMVNSITELDIITREAGDLLVEHNLLKD
ncbi:MAG: hypothetical protein CMO01_24250 [Thalassobius sp.]|nr:hypothetical protein [Thalassovita sp.]